MVACDTAFCVESNLNRYQNSMRRISASFSDASASSFCVDPSRLNQRRRDRCLSRASFHLCEQILGGHGGLLLLVHLADLGPRPVQEVQEVQHSHSGHLFHLSQVVQPGQCDLLDHPSHLGRLSGEKDVSGIAVKHGTRRLRGVGFVGRKEQNI